MTPRLCIALHDVAPATWPQCERLLDLVDGFGRPPVTLLAVPNFHERGLLSRDRALVRALQERIDGGDEVALHGYMHRDDAPPPRTPSAWLRRRLLTAGEGEFAALAQAEAARRLRRGWDEFAELFCPVRGFVAPAWLYGRATWSALRASRLRYAATRDALVALPGLRRVAAPAITLSARSAWRRRTSRIWLRTLLRATASLPLVRVALHPGDALHGDVLDDWSGALGTLLAQRKPVTKAKALEEAVNTSAQAPPRFKLHADGTVTPARLPLA